MEDRASSPVTGRSSPSSAGDPLDCISPRPVPRPRVAPPSPTTTSPAPPTPSASRSVGPQTRGESPLKRQRLSLPSQHEPVSPSMSKRGASGPTGELRPVRHDDTSDDSDVVPTSDTEEQELVSAQARSRIAQLNWEEAQSREQAWRARLEPDGHGTSSLVSSPNSGTRQLIMSPQPRSPTRTGPLKKNSSPASSRPTLPPASPSRSAGLRSPSSIPLARYLPVEHPIAGPSRLGYQPHLSPPSRRHPSLASPAVAKAVQAGVDEPNASASSALPLAWSSDVDEEQLAAVGEPRRRSGQDGGAINSLEHAQMDHELGISSYTPPALRSASPGSLPRSRSATPQARDPSLPLVGISSLNPDLDYPNLFPSMSQSFLHSQQHPLPDSPVSSNNSADRQSPQPRSPPRTLPISSILTPALSSGSSARPSPARPAAPPLSPAPGPLLDEPTAIVVDEDGEEVDVSTLQGAQLEEYQAVRTLRHRTALQLNPYEEERRQYRLVLALGNNKEAVVPRREEREAAQRANGGRVEVDPSLQGWLTDEEPTQEEIRRRKGKGRAVEDDEDDDSDQEKRKAHELSKEELARAFDGAGGLMSSSDSEGDEVQREREAAGLLGPPKRRKVGAGKDKDPKQVRVKKGKKFPMGFLVGEGVEAESGEPSNNQAGPSRVKGTSKTYTRRRTGSPRRPFAVDRSPSPGPPRVDRLPTRAFDDYPPDDVDNGTSPSPPRAHRSLPSSARSSPPGSQQGRQLSRQPLAGSESASESSRSDVESSSADEQALADARLERKKLKALRRMLPGAAISKAERNVAKQAAAEEARRLDRLARRPVGPVKAGQSVVRKAAGGAVRPKRVASSPDVDADMDASDTEVFEDPAFYLRAEQGRERGASPGALEAAVMGRYGHADDEPDESSSSEAIETHESEPEDLGELGIKRWLIKGGTAFPRGAGGGRNQAGPASERAMSVVDHMLSRTDAQTRPRLGGNVRKRSRPQQANPSGGGVGGKARSRLSSVSSSSRNPGSDAPRREPSHPVQANGFVHLDRHKPARSKPRPNQPARARPRHSGPPRPPKARRPPAIVLDDDSIFGGPVDLHPPGQDENANVRRPARRFVPPPRPPRPRRRAAAGPGPLRPRLVNDQVDPLPRSDALARDSPAPDPAADAAVLRDPLTDGVPWTRYDKFAIDLHIPLLDPGISFPADRDVSQGRLLELVSLINPEADSPSSPSPESCSVFQLELTPEMSRSEFTPAFEIITDQLFETLERARTGPDGAPDDADEDLEGEGEARRAMRFVCLYISKQQADDDFVDVFKPAVQDLLDHLFGRMEDFAAPKSSKRAAERRLFFAVYWFAVELSARLDMNDSLAPDVQSTLGYALLLIRRLLAYECSRTFKLVRDAHQTGTGERLDMAAEAWVNVIHLTCALDRRQARTGRSSFWSLVEEGLEAMESPPNNLVASERIWYILLGFLAVSQFSALGRTSAVPTLSASWETVSKAIANVRLEANPVMDKLAPSEVRSRRDQYVWTVVARCHLLATRWRWQLDEQGPFMSDLGHRVFKTRGFSRMWGKSDPTTDFPLFIRQSNKALFLEVNEGLDSAFDIYLKLTALTARDMRAAAKADDPAAVRSADLSVARLLGVAAPLGALPFTRANPPGSIEQSQLLNRYSSALLSVIVDPSVGNSSQAIKRMRHYLSFKNADFVSRRLCIRAMMHMANLHRHFYLDLQVIAEWIGEMADTLVEETKTLDRPLPPVTMTTNGSIKTGSEGSQTPRAEIVASLSLLLGAIRKVITTTRLGEDEAESETRLYPDPILLHASWIKGVLTSSLATDPHVGREVVECVEAFLDAREAYFASQASALQPSAESQDEFRFEFDDIDMNDPDLCAILGFEPGEVSAAAAEKTRVAAMEKTLARVLGDNLSPAIYKLLSNLLAAGPEAGTGVPGLERDKYIARLTNCWVGAASVSVQQGDKDWSRYLGYGAQSWERIGNESSRRSLGLRFMYNIAALDPRAYEPHKEQFVAVWFLAMTVPSPLLTIEPEFCALVLDLDKRQDLFTDMPLEKDSATGRFVFDKDVFIAKRIEILSEVFASLNLEIKKNAAGNQDLVNRKIYAMNAVRQMLKHMEDHVLTLKEPDRTEYIPFCLKVLDEIKGRAGGVLTPTAFPEITKLHIAIGSNGPSV